VSEQTGFYRIRFAADPVQLMFFRGGLTRWLDRLRWPEPERIDAVLAISEACGNSVEHAYPSEDVGEVEVVGRVVVGAASRRIVVVVQDTGQWRGTSEGHGFGLTTVHACMEQVRIRHGGSGTTVTMTSRPVPLLDAPSAAEGGHETPVRPPSAAGNVRRLFRAESATGLG
jgi:anti-sigma regulatory factor (Ser/Thr protein kinase)